jgi:hypothetical protein
MRPQDSRSHSDCTSTMNLKNRKLLNIEGPDAFGNNNRLNVQHEVKKKVSSAPNSPQTEAFMTGGVPNSEPISTRSNVGCRNRLCFPCTRTNCRAAFKTGSVLDAQIHSAHDPEQRYCKTCSKTFSCRGAFQNHVKNLTCGSRRSRHFTENTENIRHCNDCKRTYASPSKYILHFERVHLRLKSHTCRFCREKFHKKTRNAEACRGSSFHKTLERNQGESRRKSYPIASPPPPTKCTRQE